MMFEDIKDAIVRSEDEGPQAEVVCAEDGTSATATWVVPAGQLLTDAEAPEELDTGGYVYFTPHDAPTDVIKGVEGGETADFSGATIDEPTPVSITTEIDPGVEYRAHVLLAYEGEDGARVHTDTVFVCDAAPVAEATTTTVAQSTTPDTVADTLPMTGISDVMLPVALVLTGLGALIVGALRGWGVTE